MTYLGLMLGTLAAGIIYPQSGFSAIIVPAAILHFVAAGAIATWQARVPPSGS